jgi:hypothetical protein
VVEKKRSARRPPRPPSPRQGCREAGGKRWPKPAEAKAAPADKARPPRVVLRQLSDEERRAALPPWPTRASPTAKPAASPEQDASAAPGKKNSCVPSGSPAEKRKVEEDARKAADELAKKRAEQEARPPAGKPQGPAEVAGEAPRRRLENEEGRGRRRKKIGGKLVPAKAPRPRRPKANAAAAS